MNELGEQVRRWTEYTSSRFGKWMREMDSTLGKALADWVAQEKRVVAFQQRTREVETKLKRHDEVIQELITRLYEQKDSGRLEQQSRFQQTIREKVVRIETLHRQLQEKEEVVVKSRLAIQQLMFKVDASKNNEENLKSKIQNQKEKLNTFDSEKHQLESQIIKLQTELSHTMPESEFKKLLEMKMEDAKNRINEIEKRELQILKENKEYEKELLNTERDRILLSEQVLQMERIRENLLKEKQQLLHNFSLQEQQIQQAIKESEKLQKQLIISQQEGEEAYNLWTSELAQRTLIEREKEELDLQYDKMLAEWGAEKKKYEHKERRLENRLGRRIGKSIPHILVEPEFEKDYLELKEDEQSGVDAALYELSLGWHTGNVHFRSNSVKGKSTSFQEYAWGASHQVPGRLYVKKEKAGYRIYRISRTKDGGHRLSQKRVIDWLKKQ